MTALFDVTEHTGRPPLPDGWDAYQAEARLHLMHSDGDPDDDGTGEARRVAGRIRSYQATGVSGVRVVVEPGTAADGVVLLDCIDLVADGRVEARSQNEAHRILFLLLERAYEELYA